MTKEEALEGMKRHAEAILNLAKEIGVSDYIDMGIVDGHISIGNNPYSRHLEDGLGFDLHYNGKVWNDVFKFMTGRSSND